MSGDGNGVIASDASESGGVVALRRTLHRIPELGFVEHKTSAVLKERTGRTLGPSVGIGDSTGFYVDIGNPNASRTLLLRADMDGLPIQEASGLPFASEHAGFMHACGHDCHMAALVTAAEAMVDSAAKEGGPGALRVRVLFQPAEEGQGGAKLCISEGALSGVDHAFGLHVWNELPVGTVAVTPGGIMAGVIDFKLTVTGKGGHGGLPHTAVDPVVASAQLVLALQTVASRRSSPFEPVVLTVGAIHGGDAFNVIPDQVTLKGTVRTFDLATDAAVERDVRAISAGVGAATGTTIEVQWVRDCIPTVNAPEFAALVQRAAAEVPGVNQVLTDYRTTAGEDFGYILNTSDGGVPGAYILVGSRNEALGFCEPHHSPRFAVDEAVLPIAASLHQAVVRHYRASDLGTRADVDGTD